MKNRKFRAELLSIIREAGLDGGCDKARGALLYTAASKVGHRRMLQDDIAWWCMT